jgi:AcrR family transcriptional regulator
MSKKVDMKREYRNSIRTKKLIRTAFAELIGEKKRLSNISVAELAERADIAKSTFYNHYEDVYAVADEMMRELTDGLNLIIDAMETDSNSDYKTFVKSIFSFLRANEGMYRNLADSPDAIYFIGRIKQVITKRVFADVRSPYLSQNKNERKVQINFLAHACVDTVVDYFRGDIDLTFDQFETVILGILDRIV